MATQLSGSSNNPISSVLPVVPAQFDSTPGLSTLPYELLVQVCTKLNAQQVACLSSVNREFAQVLGDSRVWKMLCARDFPKQVSSLPPAMVFNFAAYHQCKERCKELQIIENIKQDKCQRWAISPACQIVQFTRGQLLGVTKEHPQDIQLRQFDPSTGNFVVKGTITNWLEQPQILFKDSPYFQHIKFSKDASGRCTLLQVKDQWQYPIQTFFPDETIEKVFVHKNILCVCVKSASNQRQQGPSKGNSYFALFFRQNEGITRMLVSEVTSEFQIFGLNNFIFTCTDDYTIWKWNIDGVGFPKFETYIQYGTPIYCFHEHEKRFFVALCHNVINSQIEIRENDIQSRPCQILNVDGIVTAMTSQGSLLFVAADGKIMVFEKHLTLAQYKMIYERRTGLTQGISKLAYENGVLFAEEFGPRHLMVTNFNPSSQ